MIPEEIVQKPCELTESEKHIMDLHSTIGYEILKTTDVDLNIAEAVKLHHVPYNETSNTIASILSAADAFSALKEDRPYKPSMSNSEAIKVMTVDPTLSKEYVGILKNMHA